MLPGTDLGIGIKLVACKTLFDVLLIAVVVVDAAGQLYYILVETGDFREIRHQLTLMKRS